jgi:hypothetical protein
MWRRLVRSSGVELLSDRHCAALPRRQMWLIWIILPIEAGGFLLVAGLLLTAAPKSEKELRYEDEAQVRALANWRTSGCRGWVATESSKQSQDIGSSLTPIGPPGGGPSGELYSRRRSIIT